MMKYFISGVMTNLRNWIKIERNPVLRKAYIEFYNSLKEKLKCL